jgi:DNA-binding CsgD family transcriptional regulator
MGAARGSTPVQIRAMLRLSRTLHTSEDAVARKKQLLAGLCELLDAGSAMSVVAHVERIPRRHTIVSVVRHGLPVMREEQLLGRCLSQIRSCPITYGPICERRWQQMPCPLRPPRGMRLNHCLHYSAAIYDAHVIACLSLARGPQDRRPFITHERTLLHLIHSEMSWVYETDLLLATHGAATLSPRQRQTLEYLLAGHSEKQIAARMRLSPNTVHHHVKALYRHFGVSSRSELLAKWVR